VAALGAVRCNCSACAAWVRNDLAMVAQIAREYASVWNARHLLVDILFGDAVCV
jgi:hypothetical protein